MKHVILPSVILFDIIVYQEVKISENIFVFSFMMVGGGVCVKC